MTAAVELLLGGGMGLFLGLFGGGGSIVAVPIFVYLLGYGVKEAVAMSLVVVGLTSAIGAARAWRAGDVRPRSYSARSRCLVRTRARARPLFWPRPRSWGCSRPWCW